MRCFWCRPPFWRMQPCSSATSKWQSKVEEPEDENAYAFDFSPQTSKRLSCESRFSSLPACLKLFPPSTSIIRKCMAQCAFNHLKHFQSVMSFASEVARCWNQSHEMLTKSPRICEQSNQHLGLKMLKKHQHLSVVGCMMHSDFISVQTADPFLKYNRHVRCNVHYQHV